MQSAPDSKFIERMLEELQLPGLFGESIVGINVWAEQIALKIQQMQNVRS